MTKEPKLNLHQKLVEIRKAVTYVQHNAKGYNFGYADDTALLKIIRPVMDELGVILEVDMPELTPVNEKFCQAGFTFVWVNAENPSEKITKQMFLQTVIGDAQKLGGLMTYATRYFLYKYFSVSTGKDDPDSVSGRITVKQLAQLETEINGDVELRNNMLAWAQAGDFSEIRGDQLGEILATVAKHKANKKEATNV